MSNKRTETQKGYVYFIVNKINRTPQGQTEKFVKIGFTKARKGKTPEQCIEIRKKQLQTGCPNELKLLYYVEGTKDTEQFFFHNYFGNSYNERLEWYEYGFVKKFLDRYIMQQKVLKEEGIL